MTIEYLHASKFGNGAMVAEEFKQQMATRGVAVDVHHIREITPEAHRRPTCTCSARPAAWADRSGGCADS